jgi:hypothetical protein
MFTLQFCFDVPKDVSANGCAKYQKYFHGTTENIWVYPHMLSVFWETFVNLKLLVVIPSTKTGTASIGNNPWPAWLNSRVLLILNKLPGFVRGAIRRLDLQREESSESSVWDVDIKSTEFPGLGNIAQMLIF